MLTPTVSNLELENRPTTHVKRLEVSSKDVATLMKRMCVSLLEMDRRQQLICWSISLASKTFALKLKTTKTRKWKIKNQLTKYWKKWTSVKRIDGTPTLANSVKQCCLVLVLTRDMPNRRFISITLRMSRTTIVFILKNLLFSYRSMNTTQISFRGEKQELRLYLFLWLQMEISIMSFSKLNLTSIRAWTLWKLAPLVLVQISLEISLMLIEFLLCFTKQGSLHVLIMPQLVHIRTSIWMVKHSMDKSHSKNFPLMTWSLLIKMLFSSHHINWSEVQVLLVCCLPKNLFYKAGDHKDLAVVSCSLWTNLTMSLLLTNKIEKKVEPQV